MLFNLFINNFIKKVNSNISILVSKPDGLKTLNSKIMF